MCLARLLPRLSGRASELAGPLGLAFRLLYPLAGALELLFGDPQALLGDLGLQPCALERLDGLTGRAGFGSGTPRQGVRAVCAGRRTRW